MIRNLILLLLCLELMGCMASRPKNINNACSIITEYPDWYYDAKDSYQKWGVPISVQFAMIRSESHFKANALPPRNWYLGFIPGARVSTAYGYSQALDGTWEQYERSTGNYGASRTNFADAVDFIGWYGDFINKRLKIRKTDTYQLYLAYHQGPNNFHKISNSKHAALIRYAKKTQAWAWKYAGQLKKCDIPSKGWWF
jgi:hypothetical protein